MKFLSKKLRGRIICLWYSKHRMWWYSVHRFCADAIKHIKNEVSFHKLGTQIPRSNKIFDGVICCWGGGCLNFGAKGNKSYSPISWYLGKRETEAHKGDVTCPKMQKKGFSTTPLDATQSETIQLSSKMTITGRMIRHLQRDTGRDMQEGKNLL